MKMTLKQRLEWFSERKLMMLFLWRERFWNPLIPEQRQDLKSSGLLEDKTVLAVLHEHLPNLRTEASLTLPAGMYFPLPMARALEQGEKFTPELAFRFHYDFIVVDECQQWSLRGKPITGKVLALFEENLFYELESGRSFVEYWSENRWDKCYLDCAFTPFRGLALEEIPEGLRVQLNNGKTDLLDLHSFRLDAEERCFALTQNHGEILLADAPRFWLLEHLDETGSYLIFGKLPYPLYFSF